MGKWKISLKELGIANVSDKTRYYSSELKKKEMRNTSVEIINLV